MLAREIGSLIEQETRESFDLAAGPLLRALLLPLASDRHLLVITTHYVAADGLSEGTLLAELGSLYAAFGRGEDAAEAASTLQYADFAQWHGRWIDALRAEQSQFWKQQLRGSSQLLTLPTDRPRPELPTFEGATKRFAIDPEVARQISAAIKPLGFRWVSLDLEGYRTVSLNEILSIASEPAR